MQRNTLIALAVLAVIAIAAFLTLRAPEKGERRGPQARPVAAFKAADVKQLELASNKEQIVLRAEGTAWKIASPGTWNCDPNVIKSALDQLEKLKFGDPVTTKPERYADLEVSDDKGTHVVAKDAAGKVLLDGWIGKSVSGYTMFRLAGQNEVWQTTGVQKYAFARDLKGWRDKTVIEVAKADVTKLTVENAGQKIVLEKIPPADAAAKEKPSEVKWKVLESSVKVDPFDDATANSLVQTLSSLRATNFADDAKPAEVGLDPALISIAVQAKGVEKRLLMGKLQGEEGWIQAAGQPQIYILQKHTFEQLAQLPINFRDKTLVKAKEADLLGIDIAFGGEALSLRHEGGAWKSVPPAKEGELDEAKLRSLVGAFDNLQGSSFAPQATAKSAGLDRPTATVKLRLRDQGQVTLKVGALKGTPGNEYYVARVGSPDIFLLKKWTAERFMKKPADLVKKAGGEPGRRTK